MPRRPHPAAASADIKDQVGRCQAQQPQLQALDRVAVHGQPGNRLGHDAAHKQQIVEQPGDISRKQQRQPRRSERAERTGAEQHADDHPYRQRQPGSGTAEQPAQQQRYPSGNHQNPQGVHHRVHRQRIPQHRRIILHPHKVGRFKHIKVGHAVISCPAQRDQDDQQGQHQRGQEKQPAQLLAENRMALPIHLYGGRRKKNVSFGCRTVRLTRLRLRRRGGRHRLLPAEDCLHRNAEQLRHRQQCPGIRNRPPGFPFGNRLPGDMQPAGKLCLGQLQCLSPTGNERPHLLIVHRHPSSFLLSIVSYSAAGNNSKLKRQPTVARGFLPGCTVFIHVFC